MHYQGLYSFSQGKAKSHTNVPPGTNCIPVVDASPHAAILLLSVIGKRCGTFSFALIMIASTSNNNHHEH
jgi:hypothetical protein